MDVAGPRGYTDQRMYEESIHLVDDLPRDAADAANGRVCDLVEGVGREVEITYGACLAPVGQLYGDGLILDCG